MRNATQKPTELERDEAQSARTCSGKPCHEPIPESSVLVRLREIVVPMCEKDIDRQADVQFATSAVNG